MFREAKALLATAGVELIHAIAVRNPADLNAVVGALISSGAKMVIVGGGDGSVSGSVDSFVDKDCIFALLPLGTANSFARTLGIPLDLPGARSEAHRLNSSHNAHLVCRLLLEKKTPSQ